MPSAVYATASNAPARGFTINPVIPYRVPLANPFNPPCLAPWKGLRKTPVSP